MKRLLRRHGVDVVNDEWIETTMGLVMVVLIVALLSMVG
jgi:hypothetical protein